MYVLSYSGLGADACPVADPSNPPLPPPLPAINFMRVPGTCPDGTSEALEKNPKCLYGVSIPWPLFAKGSTVASGGNRYMDVRTDVVRIKSIPARTEASTRSPGTVAFAIGDMHLPTQDATAMWALWMAANVSKNHFRAAFGPGQEHQLMKMKDVLRVYAGKLATEFGIVKVEVQPNPEETAVNFVNRGGYLLWIDPQTGVFTGYQPIQTTSPWWAPDNIGEFALYIRYKPSKGRITYKVGLHYVSGVQNALNKIGEAFAWAMQQTCAAATDKKMAEAAAAAAVIGPGVSAPYIAAWAVVASACGRTLPKCPPPSTVSPPVIPLIPQLPAAYQLPQIPPEKWFETPKGKVGIAVGVTATISGLFYLVTHHIIR